MPPRGKGGGRGTKLLLPGRGGVFLGLPSLNRNERKENIDSFAGSDTKLSVKPGNYVHVVLASDGGLEG